MNHSRLKVTLVPPWSNLIHSQWWEKQMHRHRRRKSFNSVLQSVLVPRTVASHIAGAPINRRRGAAEQQDCEAAEMGNFCVSFVYRLEFHRKYINHKSILFLFKPTKICRKNISLNVNISLWCKMGKNRKMGYFFSPRLIWLRPNRKRQRNQIYPPNQNNCVWPWVILELSKKNKKTCSEFESTRPREVFFAACTHQLMCTKMIWLFLQTTFNKQQSDYGQFIWTSSLSFKVDT